MSSSPLVERLSAAREAISALNPYRGSHLHEADLALMGAADCRSRGASGYHDLGDAARAVRDAWLAGEVDDLTADRLFRQISALAIEARAGETVAASRARRAS